MTPTDAPRRVLWWGNVRGLDLPARLRFAREHGFDALNVAPADVIALREAGTAPAALRAMAEGEGIALTYLDPVVDWLPDWRPAGPAAAMTPFLECGEGEALDLVEALGIDRLLAVTCFPPGRHGMDAVAQHLGRLAEAARARGLTVALEAMPMWGLRRLSEVVELRHRVGLPNVRLVIDTWHYCRAGREDAVLRALEPGAIDHVQIADGTARTPPGVSLFEDCLQHRLPPGEGALPIDEILSLLAAGGHLRSVGPEVFSAELDALEPEALASRLLPGFEAALERHGFSEGGTSGVDA